MVTACSVIGNNGVESAPYNIIQKDAEANIDVRDYPSMILVSTSMEGQNRNKAFRKLFKFIDGNNATNTEIAMTAPVFMDNKAGQKIAMTAPVFMSSGVQSMMSFVMPAEFTLLNTPKPNDPSIKVSEITNYKVAAIKFSGTLSDKNVVKHIKLLEKWIEQNSLIVTGKAVMAGYNGPLTLPMFRHNEVIIPIK